MGNLKSRVESLPPWMRCILLFALLWAFLSAINVMGAGFKALGESTVKGGGQGGIFGGITSPFAGLALGILATVLVQSSSVSTSTVVAAVAAGQLPLDTAVFTIMGCNIGTTVTNTLVAMGHVRQDAEFRRAIAGATMHDFFNLMCVIVFFPLEWATGWLRSLATSMTWEYDKREKYASPIKSHFKDVSKGLKSFLSEDLGLTGNAVGITMVAISLFVIIFALIWITRTMRSLIIGRLEKSLNAVLEKSGVIAIVIGALLTISVQSSSIVTSLMIPLFASGILTLRNGFPVTLGANIGTTVTALLASLAVDPTLEMAEAGLTVALVHLLFNIAGTVTFFPIPAVRHIPIRCAEKLAEMTMKNKFYAFGYVVVVFIVIPLVGAIIFK